MTPVPYAPEVEQLQEGEEETLAQISDLFRQIQERVLRKNGSSPHATHAKMTALLKGHLIVADGLAPELAQGLFRQPGRYDTLVRFSQGPSERLSDKASGQQGMAIKVLGVHGAHVEGSRETTTQDWVLGADDPAFTDGTVKDFLATFRPTGGQTTRVPEGVIIAGSRIARGVEAALETVGLGSPHLRFFGRPPKHPASNSYFLQAPIRHGEHIAKLSVVPTAGTLAAIGDPKADTRDDDVFRHAMEEYFGAHDAEFDVRVQLCTDLDTMPIENAAVIWPEDESPYRNVARLILPRQIALDEARARFDDQLAFNPIHALDDHRPLGSIMRARMRIYLQTQDFRQRANGSPSVEPRGHADVPG